MNHFSKSLICNLAFGLLCFSGFSQDNNEDQFKYCIAVKQSFEAWGECNHGKPKFESAELELKASGDKKIEAITISPDQLNKAIAFDAIFKGSSEFNKGVLGLKSGSDGVYNVGKLEVNTVAKDIRIDKKLKYESVAASWRVGANEPVSGGGSDPCSWLSSKREGYTMSTTVIVDDPVMIAEPVKDALDADMDYLELEFDRFYLDKDHKDILLEFKVNVDSHKWEDVGEVIVRPGAKTYLFYSQIAGLKSNSKSNYYKWLDKVIGFRVKKVLLNGRVTYGNTVNVKFNGSGPRFRVKEVKRSWCNDNPVVDVEFLDQMDLEGFDVNSVNWEVKRKGDSNQRECIIDEKISATTYRLKPTDPTEAEIFKEGGEWTIQMQFPSRTDLIFPVATFTIPDAPAKIIVEQGPMLYPTVGTKQYHLLSAVNPYVHINISDEHKRLPYSIYKIVGGDTLFVDKLVTEPSDYDSLEPSTQAAIRADFDKKIAAELKTKGTNWEKYFNIRFNEWFYQKSQPQRTDITSTTGLSNCNTKFSINNLFVMSANARYLATASFYNISEGGGSASITELSYSTQTAATQYHTFWKNNAKSDVFSFDDPNSTSSGHNSTEPGAWLKIDNSGNCESRYYTHGYKPVYTSIRGKFHLVKYNGCSIIGRDESNNYHLVGTLGEKSSVVAELPGYADGIIGGAGTICAYRNGAGNRLYFYEWRNGLRSWPASQITNIRYINTTAFPAYVVYETASGDKYQQFLLDESNRQQVADHYFTTESLYRDWYEDYLKEQWQQYLIDNYGHKLFNHTSVNPGSDETYILIGSDGCEVDFPVNVKVPPQPEFTVSKRTNPGTNCSSDGIITLVCTKGSLPLSCDAGTLEKIGDAITVTGLNWSDEIEFHNSELGLSYIWPVSFTGNPNGIQSVSATAQTCGSSANGSITVNFASNSTDIKTYRLTDMTGKTISEAGKASNLHTFTGLDGDKSYKVFVSVGECELAWDTPIKVENKIFSISATVIDAAEVGGNGSATIKVSNLPSNVVWTGDSYNEGLTTKIFSAGEYVVEAKHDGCTTKAEFEVLEPGFTVDIEVLRDNDSLLIAVSNLAFNSLVKEGKLEIKDNSGKVFGFNEKLPSEKEYVLNLNYNNKVRELYRISNSSFSQMSLAHNVNLSEQKCPGDKVELTIVPVNPGGDFKVNFEGLFDNNLVTSTTEASFSYAVQTSKSEIKNISSSLLNLNMVLQETKAIEIPQVQPVYANVVFSDISCHGSNDGTLSVSNARNSSSGRYRWRLGNNDTWMGTLQIADKLTPKAYDVYLRDSGNQCAEVKIGTVTIEEPPVLELVSRDSFAPVCADGLGRVSLSVAGGNGLYRFQLLSGDNKVLQEYPLEGIVDEDSLEEVFYTEDGAVAFSDLNPGTYRVLVRDPAGCSIEEVFELPEYLNPAAGELAVEPVSCYGQSDGAIKVSETTGSGELKSLYLLDQDKLELAKLESPESVFNSLSAGLYNVYLEDENGCRSELSQREVKQPLLLEIEVDYIDHVVAKGESSGRIQARALGGNDEGLIRANVNRVEEGVQEFYSTHSLVGGLLKTFNNLRAGNYIIEVADHKGCEAYSETIEVLEPQEALSIEVLEVRDALCKAEIGSISIKGQGGWGGYTYRMATKGGYTGISTFEELPAGSYEVMLTDSMGAKVSETIIVNEPDLLTVNVREMILPTCDNNGAFDLEVSGGNWPYKMFFSHDMDAVDIATPQTVTVDRLAAGEYLMTVVDNNGCRATTAKFLGDSDLLKIVDIESGYPSSPGMKDGSLKALVEGGKEPVSFEWNRILSAKTEPVGSSAQIHDLAAGYYGITVSEAGGCSRSEQIYLPDLSDGFLSVEELGHETSYAAKDGYARLLSLQSSVDNIEVYSDGRFSGILSAQATISAEGVLWLKDLSGGRYFIKVTGTEGIEAAEFEIEEYQRFTFGKIEISHVSRRDLADGAINVNITGGAAPFIFEWEASRGDLTTASYVEGERDATIKGLPAGNYTLVVIDRYANTIEQDIIVDEPQEDLLIELVDYANQSCYGYENAWVQVKAAGGWGEYQYRHSDELNYTNSWRWNDLAVGEHKFYTLDKRGIRDSISVTITEPDLLRAGIAFIDSVKCYGGGDGKAYFEVRGGSAPYRFALVEETPSWRSNTDLLSIDGKERSYYLASNLTEGSYLYSFTDANNCPVADVLSVYVPQPEELLFSYADIVHTTCNTDNGSIEVGMQGGTLPYSYQWIDNSGQAFSTEPFVSQLKQGGYYRLSVRDKHNCETNMEQTIKASTLPQINAVTVSPVLCYGDSNGGASVLEAVAAEPYAPYRFIWSNGLEGETAEGFPAGRHFATIIDANNCETTKYFDIATPDTLGLNLIQLRNAHCFGYNDGRIEVRALGGVGDYSFLWSNGATTNVAENLSKGLYTLSFTDANNCLFEQTYEIDEPPMQEVYLGEDIRMCPDNSIVIDGQGFAAHRWTKGEVLLSEERYYTLSDKGEYALRVTNDRGCFGYDTIAVSIGNDALQADFLMTSEAVLGDTLMLFELSNLPLDSLSWVYPDIVFSNETPANADDYILHLKTLDRGMYNVALYAYSGGCFSRMVKQVEVKEEGDREEDDELLGYKDPLIKNFIITPNPNDGRFNVDVELREASDIHLAVFSVSHGVKLEERRSAGMDVYVESFVLANANTGVYVVVLTAGMERRQIKIVIE